MSAEKWIHAVTMHYPLCDVCHNSIGPHGFTLGSPLAEWGYFACLCPDHATALERTKARAQWAWAKWCPW